MGIKEVLMQQLDKVSPRKEEITLLSKEVKEFVNILESELKKAKLKARVFVGGSFAKGTLLKKDKYDVDIFVRFDMLYDNNELSEMLEKPVNKVCEKLDLKYEMLHGSRDYFQIPKGKMVFEVVPVLAIKKPSQEKNVTDLSYFHVSYLKKRVTEKIKNDIRLAKSFCHAQNVYGAESYINGFSGYGLECLVLHYGGFEKMLRELVKVKDTLIIDQEKRYKNKEEAMRMLNASKLKSPIILIDPTYKERNALAALNAETFRNFQEAAKAFLKSPNLNFFISKKVDTNQLKEMAKRKDAEYLHLVLHTDRQEGDIAGTKLKKFHYFLENEIGKYFDILNHEFSYSDGQKADLHIIVKPKKEIVKNGPPAEMAKDAAAFRKANKNVFVLKDRLYSKMKVDFSAGEFIKKFAQTSTIPMEMSVTKIDVI